MAGLLFDLRGGCDLSLQRHFDMAETYLTEMRPYLLVCSSDCVAFELLRKTNSASKECERLRQQGVLHLRRVRKPCEMQLSAGRCL